MKLISFLILFCSFSLMGLCLRAEDDHDLAEMEQDMQQFRNEQQEMAKNLEGKSPVEVMKVLSERKAAAGGSAKGQGAEKEASGGGVEEEDSAGTIGMIQQLSGRKGVPEHSPNLTHSETIKVLIKSIQDIPEDTLKENLMARLKPGPVRQFLTNHPKVLTFLAKFLRDQEALPNMAKIPEDRKKMGYYAGAMIFTMILGWYLKIPYMYGKKVGKPKMGFLTRFFLIYLLRISCTVGFFHKELGPVVKLAIAVAKAKPG